MSASFQDDRQTILANLESPIAVPLAQDKALHAPPRPPLSPAELVAQFIAAAKHNAATVECLAQADCIPAATAAYLQAQQLPPQLVCTAEWEHLPWHQAGLRAECRAPTGEDWCGLTTSLAAAADVGAMLACSDTPHALTASLLPPHHLSVVPATSIVPTIAEVLSPLAARPPTTTALYCGPSRTADIEQTLTIGAHGPLAVHIFILEG